MISITVTCEKCGKKASDELIATLEQPSRPLPHKIDILELLGRIKYQTALRSYSEPLKKVVLCPTCIQSYGAILDKCQNEKDERIAEFFKE